MRHAVIALLTLFCLATPAFAQDAEQADLEGAQDHPAIARFPGFYIDAHERNDFNEYEFTLGLDAKTGDLRREKREGRYWFIEYVLREGVRAPSPLEIQRNYERAFQKTNGRLVYLSPDRDVGTFVQKTPDGERWVEVQAANQGELIQMYVIEVAGLTQKVEFTANEMRDALARDGFISLTGILFDTGRDAIKPESEPLLQEVLALLRSESALNLSIDGHTDNVGDASANEALSKRRAESVRKWLVDQGVPAGRLVAQGFGASRPVADNRTEDGRAKNRRVELVKR